MKDEITYNVKTEIKPGFFEEYVEDDIEINQEYLAIPREILIDQELKASEKMIMGAVTVNKRLHPIDYLDKC